MQLTEKLDDFAVISRRKLKKKKQTEEQLS
jgi:hypothetical protein